MTTISISVTSMPCIKRHAVMKTLEISDNQMKIPKATLATRHLRVQVEDKDYVTPLVFCV